MNKESSRIKSKNKFVFLLALSVLLSVGHTAQAATFSPTAIDISAAEIANPMRGMFDWYHLARQPSNWPVLDGYVRYSWRSIETSQGVYNFSQIDNDIVTQAASGGRFGFRVMALNSYDGGSSVPDYLMNLMPSGFWFASQDNGANTYAPDWNDPDFMFRARALIDALAARYNNDPRVGWIEIGFYGNYAEWHLSGLPTGAVAMTSANKHLIIDYHVQAFTNKHIVAMLDNAGAYGSTSESFDYAMSKSPTIGWRNDCLGNRWFSDGMNSLFNRYPYTRDRWKTAIIIGEFCHPPDFNLALTQVKNYHVSLIATNVGGALSGSNLSTYGTINKTAGYRLILRNLTLPSPFQSGQSFSVSSVWSNVNVAPFTMPWNLLIQLRNPSTGTVAWQGQSSLVFQSLLPTTNSITGVDTPVTINDSFTLNNVPTAAYDVVVTIPDPGNYYKPLALAIQGRQLDGSYKLGQITVQSSTSTPTFSKCDQNHDTSINVLDLQSLANVILGKTVCTPSTGSGSADYTCDLNQDGSVNVLDLQYLANVILGKSSCQ